ncbi:GAF domain-containing SpoIIE family protein phosphatase [Actinomycetospora aeridis]|uniref:GAF domain-containing SpoIIE family protein phosphatase n=1 Tax=Actinomycetospora aeridis TaxID=3129231 RepID=A0ABU8N7K9_9PSEU
MSDELLATAHGCQDLADPERLASLAASGLGAESDPEMDWFGERVRRWLGVPVALVSLVRADEQVFPGAAGLGEPYATSRRTPLTHSFCQHVVASAQPLVVRDARSDPRVAENLAVRDLAVVAYAGMPLTDGSGRVLGSLCAIDDQPRDWSEQELEALRDLATGCSSTLRLRLARVDADRERARRDELEDSLRTSFHRSQALLELSRSVADSVTLDDVRAGLDILARGGLEPDHVSLLVADGDGVFRGFHDRDGADSPWAGLGRDEDMPPARAVRERRVLHYPDRESFDRDFPGSARRRLRTLGLHAVVAAPVVGARAARGALVLGWRQPRPFTTADLLLVSTASAYTAQAIDHVSWVQHRVTVAREMQQALLTRIPAVDGLALAARYEPADAEEYVGGDWFDVSSLPDQDDDTVVAVSVGDIIGHELDAAIRMGQVRSMLRQAEWDRAGGPPSAIVHAFETANAGVGLHAAGTAVVAVLRRRRESDRWSMSWVNAGHPPPILLRPDGTTELLDEHGRLFGLPRGLVETRRDSEIAIPAGSLLLLYTDGLVERRGTEADEQIEVLRRVAADHRHLGPQGLADAVMDRVGRGVDDTVVMVLGFS